MHSPGTCFASAVVIQVSDTTYPLTDIELRGYKHDETRQKMIYISVPQAPLY
jgi:hypothetical protein